jgi:hypothetical protein
MPPYLLGSIVFCWNGINLVSISVRLSSQQLGFQNESKSEKEGEMEKRRHPRIGMGNLTVDVNDGVGVFFGNGFRHFQIWCVYD